MKIKLTEKEETGLTRHFTLKFEVQHGRKTHIVNAALDENCDNTYSYQHTATVDFESAVGELSSSDVEKISKAVEAYVLLHVSEIIGE